MIIRPYQAADDAALMAIEYRSPRGADAPFVHYRRCFADRAAIFPTHQIFVAESDHVLIGCIGIALKKVRIGSAFYPVGYLFDVRVDPDHRRHGLGTRLIQYAEQYLIERGAVGAYGDIVSTNAASLKLFEWNGYRGIRQLLYLEYPPISFYTPGTLIESDNQPDQVRRMPFADRDFFTEEVISSVAQYEYVRWFHDNHDSHEAGYASLNAFDQSRLYRQVALADLALPESSLQKARSLRLFDFIGSEQPALLQAVFNAARSYALRRHFQGLSAVVDAEETLPGFIFAEAERHKHYWLMFKSLDRDFRPEWRSPFYVDAREI